jgi:CHAT domain-containing protein/Tfp pilus assembly protein PilF
MTPRPSRSVALAAVLLLAAPGPAQPPADQPPRSRELTGEDTRRVEELSAKAMELRLAGKVVEAQAVVRESLAIRRRAQPADHWEIADDEHRLRTLERIAALPAEAQAEVTAVPRANDELKRLFQQDKFAEVVRLLEAGLATYQRHLGGDDLSVISARHELARMLVRADRPADAERVAREAVGASLRVLGERHPLTAQCHADLARALAARERHAEAQPLYDRALAITRAALGDDHAETAFAYSAAGMNHYTRAEYAEAEPLFRRALEIRRRRHGEAHPLTAGSYNNLAACFNDRGLYAEAEPLFHQALDARRRAVGENHPQTALEYCNVGSNLALQGRFAEAEATLRRGLEIYRATLGPAHPTTAEAETNLAKILSDQGRADEAVALVRRALEACREKLGEDHPGTADCSQRLAGALHRQGRDAEAEPLARRALAIHQKRHGDDHPDTAESRTVLAAVLGGLGEYAAAERLLRQVLEVRRTRYGEEHPKTAQARLNVAMSLAAQRRFADAEPVVRRALATYRATLGEAHPTTSRTWAGLADILHSQGRYDDASDAGRAAVRSFETARLRVSFAGLGRVSFAKYSPLPGLVCCLARTGRAEEAWRFREAGLARGLLDEVAAREARPIDADERRRERDLIDRLDRLDRRLAALDGPGSDPAPANAARRERDALLAEFTRFEAELAERHGVAAGQVFDLGRVQRQLADDEALVGWLDYAPAPPAKDPPPECWGYVVRRTGPPVWVRLAGTGPDGAWTEEDSKLDERLWAALDRTGDVADLARRLYAQRLAPLEPALWGGDKLPPARRLVVLSSAWTARVPVEAVTDRFTVSYAPSATLLASLRERRAGPRPGAAALLALGDPVFEPAGAAGSERAAPPFPSLPGTRREVEAIARLFPRADKLLGPDASEQRLGELADRGGLRGYRFVHLATHAVVDSERPLQSALILSRDRPPVSPEQPVADRPVSRGRLTAGDVLRRWRLDADLVVLSACDTGRGRYSGEGNLGFAQPFLLAGARSLVLSLWKVDDTATALLMRRFYENLLGRRAGLERPLTKVAALHEAKDWLRRLTADEVRRLAEDLPGGDRGTERRRPSGDRPESARPFEHPHFWSAFILLGDSE